MSCDQRLCPGVGSRRCGVFMSPIFRDPHPTCTRYRGIKYMADVTCDICRDWSVAQWEAFLKCSPYSGRRKKRPSDSALSPASQTPPPQLLRKSDTLHFPLSHSPLLLRGVTARGGGGCPTRGFSRGPPPSSLQSKEREGGGVARALAFAGASDSAASFLPGVGGGGGRSGIIAFSRVPYAR